MHLSATVYMLTRTGERVRPLGALPTLRMGMVQGRNTVQTFAHGVPGSHTDSHDYQSQTSTSIRDSFKAQTVSAIVAAKDGKPARSKIATMD